ncbi:unnamed protein product, partial [Didymodactylos carnosus]
RKQSATKATAQSQTRVSTAPSKVNNAVSPNHNN